MTNGTRVDLTDPNLTAFALGELQGQEAIEMATRIEQDPEAKKFVADVQRSASLLTAEFEKEPLPRLAVSEREEIVAQTNRSKLGLFGSWKVSLPTAGLLTAGILALVVLVPSYKMFEANRMNPDVTILPAPHQSIGALQSPPQNGSSTETEVYANPQESVPSASSELAKREALPPESPEMRAYQFNESDSANSQADLSNSADAAAWSAAPSGTAAAPPPAESKSLAASTEDSDSISNLFVENKALPKMKKGYDGTSNAVFGGGASFGRGRVGDVGSNTESYSNFADNGFKRVQDEALSTFSIDVDTASYANVRRYLTQMSQMPPKDSVRTEELLNYFRYSDAGPTGPRPFAVHAEVATAPWNSKNKLVRIALKGKELSSANRPASNLVFLLDVSGSMEDPNKLPLLRKSLKLLVDNMREKDRIAIVVYAGSEGVALPSTPGHRKKEILAAIDKLTAQGSTNGAAGISKAYEIAQQNFVKGGINRVILGTDGDFNVGTTSEGDLVRMIEEKRKSGVFLSVLGFGQGNYKDSTMMNLAGKGNGNYAYIDTLREARKMLVEQAGGTLNTIAKDVKIQVEFNPKYVQAYRLIGYEKRLLNKEDFNDDTKDAGEIGEGHSVTALYEIVPPGGTVPSPSVDELKYQKPAKPEENFGAASAPGSTGSPNESASNEMMTVKLRYKRPDGNTSDKFEVPVNPSDKAFDQASVDFRFAAAVAGFGMLLRDSQYKGDMTYRQVQMIAEKANGSKTDEYRTEFVEIVKKANSLQK